MKEECRNCKKEKEVALSGKSKGLCHVCYKKLIWKPKNIICKRCLKEKPMHAKNLCVGCYASVFNKEKIMVLNRKRKYGLDETTYDNLAKECIVCGFNKIVDLHHIDRNHKNNSQENLVGLCPNHHRMVHHHDWKREIYSFLESKGFKIKREYKEDDFYKK